MHFSTRTFVTVLLAATAHDASAYPQKRQAGAIPPEVLASQAASAAAAASSAAAANEAAASRGLRPLPGLQADDGAAVSLRPLPGLGGAQAVAPPVVAESTTTEAAAIITTSVVAILTTSTRAAVVVSTSAAQGLRQPPGLNTEAPAVSLQPLQPIATSAVRLQLLSRDRKLGTNLPNRPPSLTLFRVKLQWLSAASPKLQLKRPPRPLSQPQSLHQLLPHRSQSWMLLHPPLRSPSAPSQLSVLMSPRLLPPLLPKPLPQPLKCSLRPPKLSPFPHPPPPLDSSPPSPSPPRLRLPQQ